MKHFALVVLTFILFNSLSAQTRVGFAAEYGVANTPLCSQTIVRNGNFIENEIKAGKIGNSVSAGIMYQFRFGWLFFQPEVFYTKYTREFMVSSYYLENPTINKSHLETYQNAEFHLMAGLKYKNLRLGFGPAFNYTLDLQSDMKNIPGIIVDETPFGCGMLFGVGLDFKNFHFDVKYLNNFNSLTEHIDFDYTKYRHMNATMNNIRLGVAYSIPTKR